MAAKSINGSRARIDVHAHAFTPEFTRVLRKSVSRPLDIRSIWEWDENRFLGEMDRWNVTLQVLSLPQMYEYFDWENRQPALKCPSSLMMNTAKYAQASGTVQDVRVPSDDGRATRRARN